MSLCGYCGVVPMKPSFYLPLFSQEKKEKQTYLRSLFLLLLLLDLCESIFLQDFFDVFCTTGFFFFFCKGEEQITLPIRQMPDTSCVPWGSNLIISFSLKCALILQRNDKMWPAGFPPFSTHSSIRKVTGIWLILDDSADPTSFFFFKPACFICFLLYCKQIGV